MKRILIEFTQLLFASAAALISRWLFEISSLKEDMAWLSAQWQQLIEMLDTARWYRGYEYIHQIRGRRLLATCL